jgi:hypothetical protein
VLLWFWVCHRHLGHSGSYYWKGKDINTLFFTSMPFGMTATEQHAWFEYGGGQELMDKMRIFKRPFDIASASCLNFFVASPKIGKLLGQVSANLRV